jgi:hypothetical protein
VRAVSFCKKIEPQSRQVRQEIQFIIERNVLSDLGALAVPLLFPQAVAGQLRDKNFLRGQGLCRKRI